MGCHGLVIIVVVAAVVVVVVVVVVVTVVVETNGKGKVRPNNRPQRPRGGVEV